MSGEGGKNDDGTKYQYEDFLDGKQLKDRDCTDMCCILASIVFFTIWVIVASVAFSLGRPNRLLLPENFRGELCGDEGSANENNQYLFIPKPSRLSYGICVPSGCPSTGDYVCNNDFEDYINDTQVMNSWYNHNEKEIALGKLAFNKCVYGAGEDCSNGTATYTTAERYTTLLKKTAQYKCFIAFYSSGSTLNRCLPFNSGTDNATLASLAGESSETVADLADTIGVGDFFRRGFGEVDQTWRVTLICAFTACFISAIWIFLLRCFIAPIVYLCILLILVILILIGYFAMKMADDLEDVKLPGDTATEDQVTMWRVIQYVFWILAVIYIVVMFYLLKRIKTAILVIKQGSKAFLDNKILIIVPPITLVMMAAFLLWFIYVTLYIQTIGEVSLSDFKQAANDTFGSDAYGAAVDAAAAANSTLSDFNTSTSTNSTVNTTEWTTEDYVKIMHAINFFGFLWAAYFVSMFGFMIMAMTTTAWYFSASTAQIMDFREGKKDADGEDIGHEKSTPLGTMCWSLCGAIKHIGTILWGSFLIALITFVRCILLYLEEELFKPFQENPTFRMIMCCINCCMSYIERVVKVISCNAFIVCAIKNKNFCTCAIEAASILINNAIRVTTLYFMSGAAFFLVKLLIVGCNCVVAYFLIREVPALTGDEEVESGLFPLILIFLLTFIIASLFVSVLEGCTDTVMMCFLWDETNLDGGKFLNPALSKLVGAYEGVEEARIEYERKMRAAQSGNYNPNGKGQGKEPVNE